MSLFSLRKSISNFFFESVKALCIILDDLLKVKEYHIDLSQVFQHVALFFGNLFVNLGNN